MVSNYKIFKTIAIVLGLIIFFWLIYDYQNSIGNVEYRKNQWTDLFEDVLNN